VRCLSTRLLTRVCRGKKLSQDTIIDNMITFLVSL